jgi:hypothetical protein
MSTWSTSPAFGFTQSPEPHAMPDQPSSRLQALISHVTKYRRAVFSALLFDLESMTIQKLQDLTNSKNAKDCNRSSRRESSRKAQSTYKACLKLASQIQKIGQEMEDKAKSFESNVEKKKQKMTRFIRQEIPDQILRTYARAEAHFLIQKTNKRFEEFGKKISKSLDPWQRKCQKEKTIQESITCAVDSTIQLLEKTRSLKAQLIHELEGDFLVTVLRLETY